MTNSNPPIPPQTSTAVDAILDDFRANVVAWDANRGIKKAEAAAKINALIRDAILTELQPLLEEAKEASERSERKELHSNVEGVLSMIEDRIKQLTEEVTE